MSKLPMASFKTMDKFFVVLALRRYAKREAMFFIGTQTAGQPHFPTTATGTLPDRSYVKSCGRFPSRQMSS